MITASTARGPRDIAGPAAPKVLETGELVLAGVAPGAVVSAVGIYLGTAGGGGEFRARLSTSVLAGHVGLLAIEVDGSPAGEIEVVADKISRAEYEVLRADLRGVWAQLLYDPGSASAVSGFVPEPDAVVVWRRIAPAVEAIRRAPSARLVPTTARMDPSRSRTAARAAPRELARAGLGLPADLPTIGPSTRTPENAAIAGGLLRLLRLAERQAGAGRVVGDVQRLLAAPPFDRGTERGMHGLPHGARADVRYRRVLTELRAVSGAMTEPVEGPGALRLGVRALPQLYEYWVYLQVLRQVAARYGDPLSPGYGVLAVNQRGGGVRAELASGTTVRFPGDVVVVYEPELRYNPAGSLALELVRHPLPPIAALQPRGRATPDVLVLRQGPEPSALVVDAKYCSRRLLDAELAKIHLKYGRIRHRGRGVVRHVTAASPHAAGHLAWAGCSASQFRPGQAVEQLPLDLLQ
ncbi:hypothetical protein ACI8AC_10260 [Geodermatophilus sp. SYSU D00758]